MPPLTYYVVQGFKQVEGAIVAVEPKIAPGAASAKALAKILAFTHVGIIAWSKTGSPDIGKWGPPEIIASFGTIPPEFEAGGRSRMMPNLG
jgi:hypothetical protein